MRAAAGEETTVVSAGEDDPPREPTRLLPVSDEESGRTATESLTLSRTVTRAMTEYLIRRTDGEWFDIPAPRAAEAYWPTSFASVRVEGWGDWRIQCEGVEISFSHEDLGIQVSIEGDLPEKIAYQIVDEIRQNIERVTGQKGRVVAL